MNTSKKPRLAMILNTGNNFVMGKNHNVNSGVNSIDFLDKRIDLLDTNIRLLGTKNDLLLTKLDLLLEELKKKRR
ncbi:MAG: hypothetical protein LBJ98_03560 [Endomicrobium sp.]|jgi:hypothetical protein|nr:hypothetical protein [Endomicrobium sp.]